MRTIDSKILVKELKGERLEEKIGSLIVPDGVNKEQSRFEVVSVGEKISPNVLKPGDKIITYYNPGHAMKIEDQEYRVISIPDILVVL